MMDYKSVESVVRNLHVNLPLDRFPFYMIIETAGSSPQHDEGKIEEFLNNLIESSTISDGIVTGESTKMLVGFLFQIQDDFQFHFGQTKIEFSKTRSKFMFVTKFFTK